MSPAVDKARDKVTAADGALVSLRALAAEIMPEGRAPSEGPVVRIVVRALVQIAGLVLWLCERELARIIDEAVARGES